MKLSNGDVFEGMWSNDERCGFGVMKFSSGEEYKGEWEHNKMHGDTPSIRISLNYMTPSITLPFYFFCRQRNSKARQRRHFFGQLPRRPGLRYVFFSRFMFHSCSFVFCDFSTFYLRPITAANSAMQGKACTGITTKLYLRAHGLKATATAKAPTEHGAHGFRSMQR